MSLQADLAQKQAAAKVATDTAKLLTGGVLGFVTYALNLIPVFGTALAVAVNYGTKEFADWVHKLATACFGYIPSFVDPNLVPAVMAKVASDRDGLLRDITMDCVSYWGWDTGLFDYEVKSRGNRIALALEKKCKDVGVQPYEIQLLKARILKRFSNGPLQTAAENSANANKVNYTGWLVNPDWQPVGNGSGGGFIIKPGTVEITKPSNNTMIFAAAGLVILVLALRK
jgi:hypothetical protein